jgi:xanthine dehydrogenase YagS FAD-binding subunit
MILFPRTYDEAVAAVGEKRAGGIDLQERYRSGVSAGPIVDIRSLRGLDSITTTQDEHLHIGALVRIAALLRDQQIQRSYPGLLEAAAHIATPQIRTIATVGGNLWQHPRCWYYRHPQFSCYRKGGDDCPARTGNHLYGVCFDSSPCVAPYPSTLGLALLAYDASLQFHGESQCSLLEYFQDEERFPSSGSMPNRLCTRVILPRPLDQERAAYRRVASRTFADWPLVEVIVRLQIQQNEIRFARVVVGGVAPIPLRLQHVEAALVGQTAQVKVFEEVADIAISQAKPLPLTTYKVNLLRELVVSILSRL